MLLPSHLGGMRLREPKPGSVVIESRGHDFAHCLGVEEGQRKGTVLTAEDIVSIGDVGLDISEVLAMMLASACSIVRSRYARLENNVLHCCLVEIIAPSVRL